MLKKKNILNQNKTRLMKSKEHFLSFLFALFHRKGQSLSKEGNGKIFEQEKKSFYNFHLNFSMNNDVVNGKKGNPKPIWY